MKRLLLLFPLIFILILAGCSTSMMADPGVDLGRQEMGEALKQAGLTEVLMSRPEVFYDGSQWMEKFASMVESAQQYVIITVFLGSICPENQKVIDAIIAKAESGVPVYLVYDGTGAFDMTESRYHLKPLSDLAEIEGIHVLEYHPFSVTRIINPWNLIQRDHRKFIIIDGSQVAIGGMNLNYISLSPAGEGGQRDSMYSFFSADAGRKLTEDFVEFWNSQSWDEISLERFSPAQRTDEEVLTGYLANQYGDNLLMSRMYGTLLGSARQKVDCLPFLPYSDANMQKALAETVRRGVDLTMIVPFDSRQGQKKATYYMMPDLVDTGVQIRVENDGADWMGLLHEKLMVVDGRYVCFGSSNFNYRSMNLSNEIMIVLDDEELASKVTEHFEKLKQDTYVLDRDAAQQMRKKSNIFSFIFGFFGG